MRGGISPFPRHGGAEERHGVVVGTVRDCCFTREGGKASKMSLESKWHQGLPPFVIGAVLERWKRPEIGDEGLF